MENLINILCGLGIVWIVVIVIGLIVGIITFVLALKIIFKVWKDINKEW